MSSLINGKRRAKFRQVKEPCSLLIPSLDPTPRLKAAMKEALKNSPLSREEIVDEMNRLAAEEGITTNGRSQKITVTILDKWVAPAAKQHVIPLKYLPLFCKVTESLAPFQALIAPLAAQIISFDEAKLLEWAKLEIERRRLNKRVRQLAQEVGIK